MNDQWVCIPAWYFGTLLPSNFPYLFWSPGQNGLMCLATMHLIWKQWGLGQETSNCTSNLIVIVPSVGHTFIPQVEINIWSQV